MNHQNLVFWRNRRGLTSLVVGIFFLITAVPTYAKYKPKNRKPASGYSRSSGSRGCPGSQIPLTLLAPRTFVGRTASVRPILAWYTSSDNNVGLRLFEFESDTRVKQVGKAQEIPSVTGINTLKLPTNYSELTVGKTYLWQITLDCPGGQIVKRAEFEVINPQSVVKNKFTTIPEAVDYYAENELWYEALEEALKTEGNNKKLSPTGSKLVQELAESELVIGTEIEIKNIKRRIGYLEMISQESL
ncbi:DUF928 domain-containing protein [Plectonema cf. radiosum LEGE 06105]|uniref:DUF928 domain-containing protein n=1 Tax=Plectonema cf. radiosum LEGE 06105 TaxID=945769 RepID=A0A8J7K1Y3_9CYAN|nr:DUF928 domain-containing protein [Plectonema radiosum]MBE9212457.1 DUF928 domain-containing protein [Plectonema cf. radiosum LEGE 06105]